MPNQQCLLFMDYANEQTGFSEVYWRQDDSVYTAMTAMATMAALRASLLGSGCSIRGIRVSDTDVLRDALDLYYDPFELPTLSEPCDTPWQAVQMRQQATSRYHRNTFMRGAPDSLFVQPPDLHGALPAWYKNWKSWRSQIISKNFYMRNLNNVAPFAPQKITKILLGTPPVYTVPGHGYFTGDQIRVRGIRSAPQLNGDFLITVADADTFKAQKAIIGLASDVLFEGTSRKLVYNYHLIDECVIVRATERKSGRAFDARRGRRRR